jgi:hypothetical protein
LWSTTTFQQLPSDRLLLSVPVLPRQKSREQDAPVTPKARGIASSGNEQMLNLQRAV